MNNKKYDPKQRTETSRRGQRQRSEGLLGAIEGQEAPPELQESPGRPCLEPGTLTLGSCFQNCKIIDVDLRCSAGADGSQHQGGPTLAVRGHRLLPCKYQAELSHSPTKSLRRILPPPPPCLSLWPQEDWAAGRVRVTYDCSEGTAASGSHVV